MLLKQNILKAFYYKKIGDTYDKNL